MSARGRPRKDTPAAQSPRASSNKSAPKKQEHKEDKKSTDAKTSQALKLQEQHEPESAKSDEKKTARKDNSIKEDPRKDLQSAPQKVQKPESKKVSTKAAGAKVSSTPKLQESQRDKCPNDANSTEETHAPDQKPASACSRRGSSVSENPNKVLHTALESLKLKKSQKSESAECVNDIQKKIIAFIKQHLDWCSDINVVKTGSYYENVKICEPDEFDVMLTVHVDRVVLLPFSEDGAFYSVEMKRHTRHPLDKFVNDDGTIMASQMLKEFRDKVKEVLPQLPYVVTPERKKKGCPAVTLHVKGKGISIDLVLSLEVRSSWPSFTRDGFNIDTWLGKKVKIEQKRRPFYLVPKYEGRGNAEQDGITAKDSWRISFSHVEKYILKNHGNSKTCCEGGQKCCRKECLKLLKYFLQRLKEEHPEKAEKLYSYHAKTTLLHACSVRVNDSEWAISKLSECFEQLLKDFAQNLRKCQVPNFFIPSQNLLNGMNRNKASFLADCIEVQCKNGFPLLSKDAPRERRDPESAKSDEKKTARKDNSIKEDPIKDLQSAPQKVQKPESKKKS